MHVANAPATTASSFPSLLVAKASINISKLTAPAEQIFAMALDTDELVSTRALDVLTGAKYIRGGVLVVALLRPPPTPGMPRVAASFPQKALMNLVTDLCDSR